jgi:hypothetical protein
VYEPRHGIQELLRHYPEVGYAAGFTGRDGGQEQLRVISNLLCKDSLAVTGNMGRARFQVVDNYDQDEKP